MFEVDANFAQIVALEGIMRVGRDPVVQRDREIRQLLARGLACVRRDDVNIHQLSELAKSLAHAFNEFALAGERSRVVTAYRLDAQTTKAGDVDADSAFHDAMPPSGSFYHVPAFQSPRRLATNR